VSQALGFRPGTYDARIFGEVCAGNEYRLPERLEPDDLIVDIGMHIGGFCLAALERGSHCVHGFEAEASNFACAARNLKHFEGRVHLHHKAVWRSDRNVGRLKFTGSPDQANTGGGGVIFWEGAGGFEQAVEVVRFDDVIRTLTNRGKQRVRLLKIDCEGSEFPILLTSRTLPLIDTIAGEFHEVGGEFDSHTIPERARVRGVPAFTMAALSSALERAGFRVTMTRQGQTHMGLFFAVNEGRARGQGGPFSALRRRLGLGGV
jgi:FkbM family methyltransferase